MSEKTTQRGGKRDGAGRPAKKGADKQKHSYKLTDEEKEIIDTYRASRRLDR